jgi:predicted PurR-regulated permease PerM
MSKKSEQKVARVLYMTLLTLAFLILVSPFAIAIIFAGSVSLALFPLLLRLENKGLQRKKAAAILTILFTILISIPISFFIIKGTVAVTSQLEKINFNEQLKEQGMQGVVSDVRHDLVINVHKYAEKVNASEFLTKKKIDSYLNATITFLLNFFRGALALLPVIFLLLLVTILCTYSFLKNAHVVRIFFQRLFGFGNDTMDDLVAISIRDARGVYVSNIVTAAVQALCVAVGAALTGIGDFFLVFFITFILAFIPVVGAAPVAFVCAGLAYLKGDNTAAIIMLVVGVFSGLIDNILRPWLASIGESKIPPITAFVCVLGGALLLGFPGLFIGLLIGSFAYDTLPLFWREIGRGDNSYVEEISHET